MCWLGREETTHANLLAFCNNENFKRIKQQIFPHSRTMDKWVTNYIGNVSKFLTRIAPNQDKNIELHLQEQREFLPQLIAFNHRFELQALEHINSFAYEQLRT